MRLEKAAGPADQALVDHGGFGGLFLSVTGRYWSFPLIFRMNAGRLGFPGGSVVKNLPANAGDAGLLHDLKRSHLPGSNKALVPQLFSLYSRAGEPLLSPHAATTEACVP